MSAIAGISSMAMRHVLADLAAEYERRSSQRVALESMGGVDAMRRVESGEAFDFAVLAAASIEKLAAAGRVGSRADLARSGIAIAVREGAPHPDIGSEDAVRNAVSAARAVGYSTGPSGRYLLRLFERWGIAARLVEAPPGVPVAALVARGDAEIGFQQLSELMHERGIEVVGSLPAAIQEITIFSGAVCASASQPAAAKTLLAFLASPETAAIKRGHGMEP
jgi:molybdate transport system substrate-binding protein